MRGVWTPESPSPVATAQSEAALDAEIAAAAAVKGPLLAATDDRGCTVLLRAARCPKPAAAAEAVALVLAAARAELSEAQFAEMVARTADGAQALAWAAIAGNADAVVALLGALPAAARRARDKARSPSASSLRRPLTRPSPSGAARTAVDGAQRRATLTAACAQNHHTPLMTASAHPDGSDLALEALLHGVADSAARFELLLDRDKARLSRVAAHAPPPCSCQCEAFWGCLTQPHIRGYGV